MKFLYIVVISYFLIACSSLSKIEDTKQLAEGKVFFGKVTSFKYERESSALENVGSYLVGAMLTDSYGASYVAGTATSFAYEESFAGFYTKLEIMVKDKSYTVHVKVKLKDALDRKVKLSIVDEDKVTGLIFIK